MLMPTAVKASGNFDSLRTSTKTKRRPTQPLQLAEPGSVMFLFARTGQLLVEDTGEDAVFEAAMEAGADDVQPAPVDEENPVASSR